MQTLWFIALLSAICLEGLGRKYLPQVPGFFFYFLKDIVLVIGYIRMRRSQATRATIRYLYGGFGIAWVAGFIWTLIELANPQHASPLLGAIGMRAYWLWWAAPPIIAGALLQRRQKQRAIYSLVILTVAVSVLAALQFASPADSNLNLYEVQDGQEIHASDMATVAATGRARVSSTFTFASGFVAFTVLVPTLLLSIGLDSENGRIRTAALVAAIAAAAVIPMSGSRGAILMGGLVLFLTMWAGGLFFTRVGRRTLIGAAVAVVVSVAAFPEAFQGVESRFENRDETTTRLTEIASVLPPVALLGMDYPIMGIGTGMQQNARISMHAESEWNAENEYNRYLVELGPIGYLLVWTARFGLTVALWRGYKLLKRAGRRGSAGAALSYAAVNMFGNPAFDHNWQALYFVGCGFVLAEIVAVRQAGVAVIPDGGPTEREVAAMTDPAAA